MKLLNNYILIEAIVERKEKSAGGLFLPSTIDGERPEIGMVLETSNEMVPKGSKVVYSKYGPIEVAIDDKKLLMVKVEDILAIL